MQTNSINTGLLIAAAGAVLAAEAAAQPVIHPFQFTTSGNLPPEVRHIYAVAAKARTGPHRAPPCSDSGDVEFAGGNIESCEAGGAAPVLSRGMGRSDALTRILEAGRVEGSYSAEARAVARLGESNSAFAAGYAYSKVRVRGQNEDRRGRIRYTGSWRTTQPIKQGKNSRRRFTTDPVIGRLIDLADGTVTEALMFSAHSAIAGGTLVWEDGTLTSDARDLCFEIDMPGAVTAQSGSLTLKVEGGIVTQASATGQFAGAALPSLGSGPNFSFGLPNEVTLDYDLGGNDDGQYEVEIDMDNGTETDDSASRADWVNGGVLNEIGTGFESAPISLVPLHLQSVGFNASHDEMHVADDFEVLDRARCPDVLLWPFYQEGAPADAPLLEAFVKVWDARPYEGGSVVAGDGFTNRLLDSTDLGMYRLHESEPRDSTSRPLVEAAIDMSWVGELAPGRYWVEVSAFGDLVFGPPHSPTNEYSTGDENAQHVFASTGDWIPVVDGATGEPLDFPFVLLWKSCQADWNDDGVVNTQDFLAFLNDWNAGRSGEPWFHRAPDIAEPYGDINTLDFLGFLNAYGEGCD